MSNRAIANHTVTTHEPLNLTPAPADVHALFVSEDGTKDFVPVFAFAVANVFEQDFDENGKAQSAKKLTHTQLVGISLKHGKDDPTSALEMICEDVPNFKGYSRRPAR